MMPTTSGAPEIHSNGLNSAEILYFRIMIKLRTLLAMLCFASHGLWAQSLTGPESIEFDLFHNRYLISNSDNGQILARDMAGTLSVFADNVSPSPYGLEILGNVLYANCGGLVKGFDLETGSEVFSLNLGATFLNGITTDGLFNLFVTDFSTKRLYRVRPAANAFNMMAQNLVQSPNGIEYDQANQRLVFVNWGNNAPIKAFNLLDSTVTTIATTTLGNCDGICWNGLDSWYITAWTGAKLVKFDRDFAQAPQTIATGLSSPADIDYNLRGDTVAIPNSGNNTLRFVGMPAISNVNCNLLPLETIAASAAFYNDLSSFGDSVLSIRLLNNSGLGFAYPLARFTPISALPEGMSITPGFEQFNVFASAWNPDSVVEATCPFLVTQPIMPNTILQFKVDITNLLPSNADTCFFTDTFSVNLNPDNVLQAMKAEYSPVVFPNPFADQIQVELSSTSSPEPLLFDMSGRRWVVPATRDGQTLRFKTTDIPSGVYLLHFPGQGIKPRRLVK
jgi:hypothetical protein